jgi:hypothetical protein
MGKLVTVNSGFTAVLLPSAAGLRNYNPADTVIVTDAEYAGFNAATLAAITLTTSGLADPARPGTDKLALTEAVIPQFTAVTGGAINLGVSLVTGPAAGVTYSANGFLSVAPDNPSVIPAVVGPKPGTQSVIDVYHVQGAVVSVAPTAKQWLYYRIDTAATTVSGNPVVADAAITAADQGRPVVGAGIPASSFVGTVIPGVSFRISSSATTQVDVNATASATVTATIGTVVKWPGGTVPTFTASVGAIDYFKFVTYDGGYTWYNVLTVKGLA